MQIYLARSALNYTYEGKALNQFEKSQILEINLSNRYFPAKYLV